MNTKWSGKLRSSISKVNSTVWIKSVKSGEEAVHEFPGGRGGKFKLGIMQKSRWQLSTIKPATLSLQIPTPNPTTETFTLNHPWKSLTPQQQQHYDLNFSPLNFRGIECFVYKFNRDPQVCFGIIPLRDTVQTIELEKIALKASVPNVCTAV